MPAVATERSGWCCGGDRRRPVIQHFNKRDNPVRHRECMHTAVRHRHGQERRIEGEVLADRPIHAQRAAAAKDTFVNVHPVGIDHRPGGTIKDIERVAAIVIANAGDVGIADVRIRRPVVARRQSSSQHRHSGYETDKQGGENGSKFSHRETSANEMVGCRKSRSAR